MYDILLYVDNVKLKTKLAMNKNKSNQNYQDNFDLINFLRCIQRIQSIGGMSKIISKLFNLSLIPDNIQIHIRNFNLTKIQAIICSMTIKERMFPDIIEESRTKRISMGSGTKAEDVSTFIIQFNLIYDVIKKNKFNIWNISNDI